MIKLNIFISINFVLHSLTITSCAPKPIARITLPPNENAQQYPLQTGTISGNKRFATCTTVSWFHHDMMFATANLSTQTLHTYIFDDKNLTFEPFQTLSNSDGMNLGNPEHLTFKHDGTLLAIANNKSECGITIYPVNSETHQISPIPSQKLTYHNARPHFVRFSPDSRYLFSGSLDMQGYILIWELENRDGSLNFTLKHAIKSPYPHLKPKSLDFTKNEKFVAIAFSKNAGNTAYAKSLIAIHRYNNITGEIELPAISTVPSGKTCDDILFGKDDEFLITSDQGKHSVKFHSFDKMTGILEKDYFFILQNPLAKLSYNHGIGLSESNKFFAVANYGTNTCTIYKMH